MLESFAVPVVPCVHCCALMGEKVVKVGEKAQQVSGYSIHEHWCALACPKIASLSEPEFPFLMFV